MIVCDYCEDPIDGTPDSHPRRRVTAIINRPPDPPTDSIDLHAECVDPWVAAAKQIRKP